MLIKYQNFRFRKGTEALMFQAQEILKDYRRQGYVLTVRQLYYQFVSKDLLENNEKNYKMLISTITKARLAGLISWHAIEDRNRGAVTYRSEESEENVLSGIEYGLSYDHWARQEHYVEVWVEKDALSSVIEKPCGKYGVPYLACKGYLSASEMWRAGQRFEKAIEDGKKCVIIHLGDHDPSGLDMTRDNQERMNLFTQNMGVDLRRIALNMDQIEHYAPPPNPAKVTDSRAVNYIKQYGNKSWELDALEPKVIDALITKEIKGMIDQDRWDMVTEMQTEGRQYLEALGDNWDEIREHIGDKFL